MAMGETIKRVFATDVDNARRFIEQTWLEKLEASDKEEREAAQRLIDWYQRDREEILDYLKDAAQKTFGNEIKNLWQFPVINGVPRTVKRLSQAYRESPKRQLFRNGELIEETDEDAYDQLKRLYENIDVNAMLKDVDRYSTLLNTVHVEVVPRKGGIDWDVRLRPKVTVLENPENYLDFIKFAHAWKAIDPETLLPKEGWIYWSEEDHYLIRNDDRTVIGMSSATGNDISNPYRDGDKQIIPIVTVRKVEQDEYWGRFGADLVDAVEAANIQLANLWENGFLQTAGIPVGTNLGGASGQTIRIGPRTPLWADDVTKDQVPPSLDFAHPDPDIKEMMDLIDWFIKSNGAAYGLPPSAWSLEEKRMSGIAKFLDNLELLENREDEVAMWERVEAELFHKSRIVYNTWAKQNNVQAIDDDLELKATFPKTRFPESPTERAQRFMVEREAGLTSPVEYFMKEYGDTEEEARDRAQRIAKDNSELKRVGASDAFKKLIEEEEE